MSVKKSNIHATHRPRPSDIPKRQNATTRPEVTNAFAKKGTKVRTKRLSLTETPHVPILTSASEATVRPSAPTVYV